MAPTCTNPAQNQVIYSVFVRNHTKEGTFAALEADLARIRSLGVDWVWLMPIHPIGERNRKGSLGCPYAIRDYRAVNPEYGDRASLEHLVDAIHAAGMRCMIDVVYNHTSPDSVLLAEHPEYFWRTPEGTPGNRVGDWTDIVDLDYGVPGLWDYQVETLCQWARVVDGFRCDVASFVPVGFWKRAREEVERVHPGFVWLAETVHRSFSRAIRARGMYCGRDGELFEAFDVEYDYDVQETFADYLAGRASLAHLLDLLDYQEFAYPASACKMHFLENHDLPRIASVLGGHSLENLSALVFLLRGATLLYAGEERCLTHQPSLFDRDTIAWSEGRDISGLLARLAKIKHEELGGLDVQELSCEGDIAVVARGRVGGEHPSVVGVLSLAGEAGEVGVDLPDGTYRDLIGGGEVAVAGGCVRTEGAPLVLKA